MSSNDRLLVLVAALVILALAGSAAAQPPPEEADPLVIDPPPEAAPAQSAAAGFMKSVDLDLALILDVAGAWFSAEDPAQLGGHDPAETGFTLQQLELHAAASVDPYFRLEANIVFGLFGVEVEEVYGQTLAIPGGLQARVGQFLTRFGRLNATHPHSWAFADLPLVNGKFFGAEGSRGLGVELSWLAPTPWFLELVASMTADAGGCCSRSFYGNTDVPIDGVEDFIYTLAVKQFFALDPRWSLLWGLSAQLGPNDSGPGNRSEIYGSDLYVRYRPPGEHQAVSLQVEGMFRTRQAPRHVLQDWGLYSQVVWNINRRWELGGRYERVSGDDGDPLDPDWTGARQRVSLQATFYPSHFSRLRLQGNWDRRQWLDRNDWGVILALELLAGAHGAHAF